MFLNLTTKKDSIKVFSIFLLILLTISCSHKTVSELIEEGSINRALKVIKNTKNKDELIQVLIYALDSGETEVVRTIIDKGISLQTAEDTAGKDYLFYVMENNYYDILTLLLSNNINLDRKNIEGDTPLNYACYFEDSEAVELLLKYGADPNQRNCNDRSPLSIISETGNMEIIHLLLESGADPLFTPSIFARNGIGNAVYYNNIKLVELYLNRGIEIDYRNSEGQTFIMTAASSGGFEMLKYLEQKGADINILDNAGRNVLDHACFWAKNPHLILYLLEKDLDTSYIDYTGRNNLHYIAELEIDSIEMGKSIISGFINKGVNINRQNRNGDTPIIEAILENSKMIIPFLDAGAIINKEMEKEINILLNDNL